MKAYKKYIFTALSSLWICVIFSFSLQPAEVSGDLSVGFGRWLLATFLPGVLRHMEMMQPEDLAVWHMLLRKTAHFAEYFVLGGLMFHTVRAFVSRKQVCILLAFLVCVLVAAADETLQLFVDGRAGRIADVLLDSAGAFCGMCLCRLFVKENEFFNLK